MRSVRGGSPAVDNSSIPPILAAPSGKSLIRRDEDMVADHASGSTSTTDSPGRSVKTLGARSQIQLERGAHQASSPPAYRGQGMPTPPSPGGRPARGARVLYMGPPLTFYGSLSGGWVPFSDLGPIQESVDFFVVPRETGSRAGALAPGGSFGGWLPGAGGGVERSRRPLWSGSWSRLLPVVSRRGGAAVFQGGLRVRSRGCVWRGYVMRDFLHVERGGVT